MVNIGNRLEPTFCVKIGNYAEINKGSDLNMQVSKRYLKFGWFLLINIYTYIFLGFSWETICLMLFIGIYEVISQ